MKLFSGNSNTADILRRLSRNKLAMTGLAISFILLLVALFAPLLAPYDPYKMDFSKMLLKPCREHLLGCDDLGRDVLSRIIYGTRYSLGLAVIVVIFSTTVGTFFGTIAGYFGGKADTLIMRGLDILQCIPHLLLSVAISVILGTGFLNTVIALSIASAMGAARVMRGSVMSILHMEYFEACDALNCSKFRIIRRHVLPNSFAPMIIRSTQGMANAILQASTLSFIGLGILPPTPEWGAMLSGSRNYIRDYPHVVIFPGLAIMITVFALSVLGDGIRDASDPKLKD